MEKEEQFRNYMENLILEMKNTPADNLDQLLQKESCLAVLDTVLQEFNLIYQK